MYSISRQHNLAHLTPIDSTGAITLNRLKRVYNGMIFENLKEKLQGIINRRKDPILWSQMLRDPHPEQ